MDLSEIKRALQEVNEYLAEQAVVRDRALREIEEINEVERGKVTKEIRVLTDAIDDAKRRRRFRVAEALRPKVDDEIGKLSSLDIAYRRERREICRLHDVASDELCQQRDRLASILADAAAMERQREMQIKRHRKIPVM